jgi:hypothetical protein
MPMRNGSVIRQRDVNVTQGSSMRPGQNNKRLRGRPNGRKGPNPLTRSYESSGPDVKIRGTAQHIGEKYLQLARDAQASGDPVMAESYLQHAEHYFRLIAMAQQGQQHGLGAYQSQLADAAADDADDDSDTGAIPDRFASPLDRLAPAPQPSFLPQPLAPPAQPMPERPAQGSGDRAGFVRPERGPRSERPFQERSFRERDSQPSPEKPYQEQRSYPDRAGRSCDQETRGGQSRSARDYRSEVSLRAEPRGENPFSPSDIGGSGLPAFITAPVRIAAEARDPASPAEAGPPLRPEPADISAAATGYAPHPRRRRAVKAEPEVAGAGSSAGESEPNPAGD